ncbi:Protein of unknown function [Lactobacillus delbrueckii subsp. lactis]|nr:Protein of unknown function [Lactobacillus delbrueckii subsp. lactis]
MEVTVKMVVLNPVTLIKVVVITRQIMLIAKE